MAADPRPVPEPDEVTAFFWEAAAGGRLMVQRCRACNTFQYPPEVVCTKCQSEDLVPTEVSGRGSLYSFATVDRPFHPGFIDRLPYVVALVELEEQAGLRLITNLVDTDPATVKIGMPVEVTYERRTDVTLPQFRPAANEVAP
jgi:uncharacterized OB-fold protein